AAAPPPVTLDDTVHLLSSRIEIVGWALDSLSESLADEDDEELLATHASARLELKLLERGIERLAMGRAQPTAPPAPTAPPTPAAVSWPWGDDPEPAPSIIGDADKRLELAWELCGLIDVGEWSAAHRA